MVENRSYEPLETGNISHQSMSKPLWIVLICIIFTCHFVSSSPQFIPQPLYELGAGSVSWSVPPGRLTLVDYTMHNAVIQDAVIQNMRLAYVLSRSRAMIYFNSMCPNHLHTIYILYAFYEISIVN